MIAGNASILAIESEFVYACERPSLRGLGFFVYSATRQLLKEHVTLHDNLLRYLGDSLTWIRTYHPSRKLDQFGLNYYGETVITKSGAEIAANVFSAWASLFSLSGSELVLTGSYRWEPSRDKAVHSTSVLRRIPKW